MASTLLFLEAMLITIPLTVRAYISQKTVLLIQEMVLRSSIRHWSP